MARRRGRRRKKLLDDLKDRGGYSHLKEEALDRTMWRHRFGGGFGPIVRQNTEWMNEALLHVSIRLHYLQAVLSFSFAKVTKTIISTYRKHQHMVYTYKTGQTVYNNNNNMKREMSQCCGIKKYTQTEKLQQIGQI